MVRNDRMHRTDRMVRNRECIELIEWPEWTGYMEWIELPPKQKPSLGIILLVLRLLLLLLRFVISYLISSHQTTLTPPLFSCPFLKLHFRVSLNHPSDPFTSTTPPTYPSSLASVPASDPSSSVSLLEYPSPVSLSNPGLSSIFPPSSVPSPSPPHPHPLIVLTPPAAAHSPD